MRQMFTYRFYSFIFVRNTLEKKNYIISEYPARRTKVNTVTLLYFFLLDLLVVLNFKGMNNFGIIYLPINDIWNIINARLKNDEDTNERARVIIIIIQATDVPSRVYCFRCYHTWLPLKNAVSNSNVKQACAFFLLFYIPTINIMKI